MRPTGRMVILALGMIGASAGWADDQAQVVKVETWERRDYFPLRPAGEPPTFSALPIARVLDPSTHEPLDRSNASLGCNPADVRKTFRLESANILLGEPILVEFRTELNGPGTWAENFGGNSRGLGRDGNFGFAMRHQDGTWVPDIFEGYKMMSFGGIGGTRQIEQGQPHSDWLAVQQYVAIDRPGVYDLYAYGWGQSGVEVGFGKLVEAALPAEARARLRADDHGVLVDRVTTDASTEFSLERTSHGDRRPPEASPIAVEIPAAQKAHYPGVAYATDYAHFTLTIRAGTDTERGAMVGRWVKAIDPTNQDGATWEQASAIKTAMTLARQDDFLPAIEARLRAGEADSFGQTFLGLAMRDSPRAVALLFDPASARGIEELRFLRPSRVVDAIPPLIGLLTAAEPTTRSAAEEVLGSWTRQTFGHTWNGYNYHRPTLEEGRTMQAEYRTWWESARSTFQPALR